MKRILAFALCIFTVFALCSCTVIRRATEFEVAGVFADNMVLQREKTIPIFGTGDNGLTITVDFNGQEKSTVVENGEWRINLDAEQASKEGKVLTVSSSAGGATAFSNVLIGDVWLCSGQSNMYWKIQYCGQREQDRIYASIENNLIRSCYIEPILSQTPQKTITHQSWVESSKETMALYSAYATSFAQYLQPVLDIPIGIITSSQGSTSIERWMEGGLNYNAMIYPLQPYAIKGVLWYQGENNVLKDPNYKTNYPVSFNDMCSQWRAGFENEDMPVMQTQIAGYGYPGDATWSDWANMMVLQPTYTSDELNTYTVVNYDLGDSTLIHPDHKKAVGKRAAYLALEKIYKVDGYYGVSPYVESYEFTQDGILITFGGVHERLKSNTKSARGFEICGKDGVYYKTTASIVAPNQILVNTSAVTAGGVRGIRFNYGNLPSGSIYSEEIPVMSFVHNFDFS